MFLASTNLFKNLEISMFTICYTALEMVPDDIDAPKLIMRTISKADKPLKIKLL